MKNVIILTGPTACGKSGLAVKLAKILNGEVISADSSQVYKGLDIGSAKITEKEKQNIPHYLIDIKKPEQDFNVAEFKKLAQEKIDDILSRGKVPIVCGGTGLYIKALLYDYDFDNTPKNDLLRKQISQQITVNGLEDAYTKLKSLSPELAIKINCNDEVRIVRALEKLLGEKSITDNKSYDFKYITYVINDDRGLLYNKINNRVDLMVKNGLFEEVKTLIDKGITNQNSCFKSIGYKEVYDYFNHNLDKNETIELIKKKTRNYAKRQLTLYRGIPEAIWIENDNKLEQIIHDFKNRTVGK